jgi:CubicO group peptidase (beta-lactamase class C family)
MPINTYSTPNDYQKFLYMLSNNGKSREGVQIISPAMLAAASSVQSMENTTRNLYSDPLGPSSKWGLGVAVGMLGGPGLSLVQSQRTISWGGFFNNIYTVDLECGFAVHGGTNIYNLLGGRDGEVVSYVDNQIVNLNWTARNCVKVNLQNASGNSPVTSTSP